jgi:hypothetical protein
MSRRYAGFVVMGLGLGAAALAAAAVYSGVDGKILLGLGILLFIGGLFAAF